MEIQFKTSLIFYLNSGDPYDKAEMVYKQVTPLLSDLCEGFGIEMSHSVYDDYEDESCEMRGIRRPLLGVSFEKGLRSLSSVVDFSALFLALGRLLQTGLDMKVEYRDCSRITAQGQTQPAGGR